MSKKRVHAIVRAVVEIEASSVWGGDTTWNQIAKQAEDDVRGLLTGGNKLNLEEIPRRIKSLEMTSVRVVPELNQPRGYVCDVIQDSNQEG